MSIKHILLSLWLFSSPVYAQVQTDKIAHFGLTALGTASTIKLLDLDRTSDKIGVAVIWVLTGLAKESMDNRIDKGDIMANITGAIYGYTLSLEWELK